MLRIVMLVAALFFCGSVMSEGLPSVEGAKTVGFIGKQFHLKEKVVNQSVPVYEFFQEGDNPPAWNELVDFRIYPKNPEGNEPKEHAARTARLVKQRYPYIQFALYESKDDGAILLNFFYPMSSRKDGEYLEFNAFKFYKEPGGTSVMSFHYAKNIKSTDADRPMSDVSADIKATRSEVISALAQFPLYRQ